MSLWSRIRASGKALVAPQDAKKTPATSAPTKELGYATVASVMSGVMWADSSEDVPELRWPASAITYDKMRRQDTQVGSVLKAITLPILATPWYIDPNGADPKVVSFVANELGLPVRGQKKQPQTRRRDRFSMTEHLRLALTMLPYGHAVFEQVYRFGDDQLFHLRKLGWRPPKTIARFNVASDGGLISIQQKAAFGVAPAVIPVSHLVAYVNEREGGRWDGNSVLRPAYKNWLLKDMLLRIGTGSADRNGMGIVVYQGAEIPDMGDDEKMLAMQQDDIKAGLDIATKVRSGDSAGAAIAHGASLTVTGVTGQLPDTMSPIRYHDEQIAASVLAHFLNLGQQTGTGSYALGSTFADFFNQALQGVATYVADTFTDHVIEDLVDVNFGTDVQAPRLAFDQIGAVHVPPATDLAALAKAGVLQVGPVLENFVRTMYGISAETWQRLGGTDNGTQNAASRAGPTAKPGNPKRPARPLVSRKKQGRNRKRGRLPV